MDSPQKMVTLFPLSISIVYVNHINVKKAEKPKLAKCTPLCFFNPEQGGVNCPPKFP